MQFQLLMPVSTAAARFGWTALALSLTLAACRPADAPAKSAGGASKTAAAVDYVAPPDLDEARRGSGGVTLLGHAPAGAQVRLASPDGSARTVAAGADGRWSMTLPAPQSPAMFALSAKAGPRLIRAEGAVMVLPEPAPPALMVRAGFAAAPLGSAPAGAPVVTALDYDRGGGAAVAGLARPMARVRLSVDGAAAGLTKADELGRFAVLAANLPLAPGERRIQIETGAGRAEVRVEVSRPQPLGREAYRAVRQSGGWRVDWSPAGGGVQTTVVFDTPSPPIARPAS